MVARLKGWYYIAELAGLAQMEVWRLRRMLQREHPDVLHRNGRGYFVYLHDLQTTLDSFWQSILAMEALKAQLPLIDESIGES